MLTKDISGTDNGKWIQIGLPYKRHGDELLFDVKWYIYQIDVFFAAFIECKIFCFAFGWILVL
jgi:hypothetical protein